MFDTVLGQYGLIFDDVGWWSGFNKGGHGIDIVDICLGDIVEGMGNKNQVTPPHGYPIGSSVIVFDGGMIL